MAIRLNDLIEPHKKKAYAALAEMKYIDLQRAVIERGMDFELLIHSDHSKLSSFFINHFESRIDKERPKQFDHWMDLKLQERGYKSDDPVRQFKRFSPVEVKEELKPVKKAPKEKPPKKAPKEKDKQLNIYTGTKKHYTMKLANTLNEKFGKKYNKKELINKFIGQIIEKLTAKFPKDNINEKSVRIWVKRALDDIKA